MTSRRAAHTVTVVASTSDWVDCTAALPRKRTSVVAENGIVHLWGYASSTAVKDAHRIAAENVPGVKRVENHMNILPPEVHFGI